MAYTGQAQEKGSLGRPQHPMCVRGARLFRRPRGQACGAWTANQDSSGVGTGVEGTSSLLSGYVLESVAGLSMWMWLVEAILGSGDGWSRKPGSPVLCCCEGREVSLKPLLPERLSLSAASSRKQC